MNEALERLQAALPKRYTLERELGRGGMATVYLARESHPRRRVAIKVLQADVSVRVGRERFLREVDLLSNVTHPHIVPIFAAGEANGFLYYVMPFVEGESLRERLQREGRLPLAEALRIVAQVAEALQHAHRRNVVHRDIKPENILVHDGYALVTDFGVARAISEAGTDLITETGIAVGTPAYMSPEQASGSSEIDGRTDIYALGCVLYEMLAGEPPFGTGAAHEIMARHVGTKPPSLRMFASEVPIEVDGAVRKALAKAPEDRYQTPDEFAEVLTALRSSQTSGSLMPVPVGGRLAWRLARGGWRTIAAGLVVVALMLVATWRLSRPPGVVVPLQTGPYIDSVSVMPVENLTGDPSLDPVGDALTYDVISNLHRIPELKSSAYVSVRTRDRDSVELHDLATQLGVRLVLVPQFRRIGGRLRLEAELVEAATGRLVGSWSDWVATQNEAELLAELRAGLINLITSSVGLAARPQLAVRIGPAQEEYLLGKHWLGRRTPAGVREAITRFRSAIQLDSASAPAFEGLSTAYMLALFYRYNVGLDGYEIAGRALAAAERAVRLDPSYPPAYAARGYATSRAFGPTRDAARDFNRALELEPNSPQSVAWSSSILLEEGREAEALDVARHAIDFDPFSPARRLTLAYAALPLGLYDVVIEEARRATELEPELTISRALVGRALLLDGRAAECVELEFGPHEGVRAACLWELGRRDEARGIIDSLTAAIRGAGTGDATYTDVTRVEDLACYYAWVGDAQRSVDWLAEAYLRSPLGVEQRVLNSALFDRVRVDRGAARRLDEITSGIWQRVRQASRQARLP